MPNPVTLLVDNGSLAAAATRQLRALAGALAQKIGRPVAPVSLLHSAAVPVAELDGVPAEIFESALARRLGEGHPEFLVVPLFFGPSRALTDYLPERVAQLRRQHPELHVGVAPVLFDENDGRLAQIMADHVRSASQPTAGGIRRIALVDHGSPVAAVSAVRDALACQLAHLLGAGAVVGACSMERREGSAYDFNEPLLASLLARDGWNRGVVTVAMEFLLPGRHAGPAGDVAHMCRMAMAAQPGLQTQLTPLVGEHPLLVEILADRWRSGWSALPE
ncbi:MAG: cobalamin biosynthesis protein CbiX [Candidatus Didemnitutus sp.]|nr:cobalamin biosynthesis protein CbiX [Candidatus Didemnitutus sp.]